MSDQSDSEDKHRKQEPVDPKLGDWSPDYFPVSAKPIFRRSLLLLLGVGALCFSVAYCSEHEEVSTEKNSQDSSDPSKPAKLEDISDDDTDVF